MNNYKVFAWLDDLEMSACLAKLSTLHSYELQFCEKKTQLTSIQNISVFIVDLDGKNEKELIQIHSFVPEKGITIIGYTKSLNITLKKYFMKFGYNIVFRRNDILKNLDSVLKNIFNAV